MRALGDASVSALKELGKVFGHQKRSDGVDSKCLLKSFSADVTESSFSLAYNEFPDSDILKLQKLKS